MDCQTTENKKQRGYTQTLVRVFEIMLVLVLRTVNVCFLHLNGVILSQVCAPERKEHATHA